MITHKRSIIYNFIDHVFYINLSHRNDRREHMEKLFQQFGIDEYERFEAIQNDYGILGCTKSHQMVYKIAKERGYKSILIFEDDFEFLVSLDTFEDTMKQLFCNDLHADVVMFSYNLKTYRGTQFPNIIKITNAATASCYAVMGHYYDTLIKHYDKTIPLLESTRNDPVYANDQSWKELQMKDNWYGPTERMGKQMDGYSDNSKAYLYNKF